MGTTGVLAVQEGDANWADGYAFPGFDASIRSVTSYAGDLIVAGDFINITDRTLNHVARWDGTRWQPLGTGVPVRVFDAAPYAGKLAAGRNDYGKIVISAWDGTAWSELPDLPSTSTTAARVLLEHAGQLIVAGAFEVTVAGGSTTRNIARWDGTQWRAMGDGFDAPVYDLALHDGDLIAVGRFTMTGSLPVRGTARWDGESWQPMGNGLHVYYADTVASVGGFLYAAGRQTLFGTRMQIDRWDGSTWTTWLNDIPGFYRVEAASSGLLVLGLFDNPVDGFPTLRLWNGQSWRTLASGVRGVVSSIHEHASEIVLAGGVSGVDATTAFGVAAWSDVHPGQGRSARPSDGAPKYSAPHSAPVAWRRLENWRALHNESGAGMDGIVYSMCTDAGGRLIAGGQFQRAGNTYASGIAAWNGSAWEPLDLVGVYSLLSTTNVVHPFEDRIIAGSSEVCSWGGTSWEQLGSLQGRIRDLATYHGQLIACGEFGNSGPIAPVPFYVAAWDGTQWTSLGQGFDYSGDLFKHVNTLAVWNDRLIAAGGFENVGNMPAASIASWDGNNWNTLGAGLPGPVHALTTWEGDLIAGGSFFLGSIRVARWNGTTWTPMGDRDPGVITDFAVLDGKLYAAPGGGVPASATVEVWDGTQWNPVPGAPDGWLDALVAHDGSLYAGGLFAHAGGKLSAHIARWSPSVAKVAVGVASPRYCLALAPGVSNPGGSESRLLLTLPGIQYVHAAVLDVRGRLVRSLVSGSLPAGESSLHWDGRDLAGQRAGDGVYFVRVQTADWTGTQKIVRLGAR